MKRVFRQWLAGLLSVVLVFTLLPAAALAEEADGPAEQTAVEQVQALINELPDAEEITAETRDDVQAQIDAIDAAMAELTEDQAAALDTTHYEAAAAAMLALDAPSALEQVQALINALPDADAITTDNRADVQAQIDAIDAAMAELTGDDVAALDTARYDAAVAALLALDAPSALEQVQALIDELPDAEEITAETRADVQAQIGAIDTAMLELTEDQAAALDTARYDAAVAALSALDTQTADPDPEPGALEQVQALIDALPDADTITADNRADVEAQLTAIDEAKLTLEDEDLDALDITRYMAAVEAILALDDMAGANVPKTIATERDIKYMDWNSGQKKLEEKTCSSATKVESGTTTWNNGWYVVSGKVTISDDVMVNGTVHLILTDDCILTVEQIRIDENNSLTIYGQSAQGGSVIAKPISGSMRPGIRSIGNLTINGGNITATGAAYCAGIGGNDYGTAGTITINGGIVTATGGSISSAGIGGGGDGGGGGTITINGGIVTATGGANASGIGGGSGGNGGTITINGGTVTATGGASGIGPGKYATGGVFSTGTDGNAVIVASSISDTSQQNNWSGVIIGGDSGEVYGTPTPKYNFEIPSGKTLNVKKDHPLHIASDVTMTNKGIINIGTKDDMNAVLNNEGEIINEGTIDVWGQLTNGETGIYNQNGGRIVYHFNLDIEAPTFQTAEYGYTKLEAQKITIKNTGDVDATITDVKLEGDDFTLNGGNKTTLTKGTSDTSWTIQPVTGLSVGTHTATITVTYSGSGVADRTATAEVTFTVIKAESDITAPNVTATYGESITLKAEVKGSGASGISLMSVPEENKVQFSFPTGKSLEADVQYDDDNRKDRGTASVTISAEQVKNYLNPGQNQVTVSYGGSGSLNPKDFVKMTVTVKEKTLTFNFKAQDKVYDGNSTIKGTFDALTDQLVSSDDNVEVDEYTAVANDANAGDGKTVTVTVSTLKGTEAGYYKPGTATSNAVEIRKAEIDDITAPAAKNRTYDGTEKDLVANGSSTQGTIQYALGDETKVNGDYSETIPQTKGAGTYYVWYYIQGDSNHNDSAADKVEVKIEKKEVNLTWNDYTDLTYSGKPVNVTATANTGISGENVTVTVENGTQTNAGTYTAKATGLVSDTGNADNYKLPSDPTQEYTIGKAPVTFTVSDYSYPYDGTAKKVTLTNSNTSSAPDLVETSGYTVTYGGDNAASQTDAGEYDIHIKLTEEAAKNYKFKDKGDNEKELTVEGTKLSIGEATSSVSDVTITGEGEGLTYGDTFTISAKVNAPDTMTGTVTFEAGGVELGKATSHDGGVWTITVDANEQVKQHAIFGSGENTKITAKYSGDRNIEASSGSKDDVTVAPKPLTYSVTATGRVWDGTTGVNVTLAATNTVRGDNVTLTATGNLANAGKAGTYTKVNLSEVKIDGTDGKYYTTEPQRDDADLTAAIQITRHDSSITPPAGKSGLTYTGEPLVLIDAATAADGSTARYYVGENAPADGAAEWLTDVSAITGLNAGEYTVWYYADGDENHEDTSVASIKVTIAPATVSFTIGAENKDDWGTKGETNTDPNPTGYTLGGSGTDYKLSMIYDSYGHKANVIQAADEAVKIEAGAVNGFTVTYKKDETGPDLTEITDAGTYDIIVNLTPAENTEDIYNFQFNGQGPDVRSLKIGTVTVTPFTVHVTWSHLKYIYHAHPMHPTVKVQNAFNSDVQPTTVPEDFDPEAGYDGKLLAYAVTDGSNVGDYEVTVKLYGTSAGNYTVEDATGTVSILAAPVTFTIGDNIWDINKEPLPTNVTLRAAWGEVTTTPDVAVHHKYPGVGTKLDVGNLNTTIEYRRDGLTYSAPDNPPTEAGIYEVWVKIGNKNYRHSATDSGDFHKVGELILTDNPDSIRSYAITFDPNYDDAPNGPTSMEKIFEKQTVIIPSASGVNEDGTEYDITRDSYRFLGWSYGGLTYQPNEEFIMPANNVDFKAEWVLAVDVSGTVKQGEDESTAKALPGATVTLKNGAEEVAETTTDNQGKFKLEQVAPGIYNMEIRYQSGSTEIIKTFLVEVGENGSLDGTYLLPTVALNTVVEVTPGITAAVDMGGIVSGEDITDVYTQEDRETVRAGGTVEFKMTIQNATLTTGQAEEIPVPADRIGMVLDLELTKTVTKSSGGSTETDIHDTKIPVITVIHLPAELQGKSSYTIYRFHDMENEEDSETLEMQTITTSPNSDGEYLKIVRDGTAIEIHAEFYSTYVLTWQQSSGGGGISRYPVNLPSETDDGTITSNPTSAIPGSRVTLTVKPDEGYHIGFLTVTDRNGKPVELTDNGDGTYTFTQPYGQVTVKVEFMKCGSLDFTDLDTKAWYHDYTDYAIAHGLMQGTGGGLFDPDGIVNRAQMVMVLWNLRGKPVVNYYMTYSDVTEDTWYSEAVRWATSEGIAGGYGNGKFGPNDSITREQMTTMIYRYEQKYGDGGFTGDWMYRLPFKDLDQISDWAFEAVAWCNVKGVITGKGNNIFDPKGFAKRSEMAAILTRFCKEAEK